MPYMDRLLHSPIHGLSCIDAHTVHSCRSLDGNHQEINVGLLGQNVTTLLVDLGQAFCCIWTRHPSGVAAESISSLLDLANTMNSICQGKQGTNESFHPNKLQIPQNQMYQNLVRLAQRQSDRGGPPIHSFDWLVEADRLYGHGPRGSRLQSICSLVKSKGWESGSSSPPRELLPLRVREMRANCELGGLPDVCQIFLHGRCSHPSSHPSQSSLF